MIRFDSAFSSKRAGVAVLAGLTAALMSTGAWAQATPANCTTAQTGAANNNLSQLAVPAGAGASALAGAIGNVNTAFLTQQGSAFVSAPANPAPDQPGGGVWVRGVGGTVDVKSTSSSVGVSTPVAIFGPTTQTTQCNNTQRLNFAGAQVGADIARLNWNGWNVHLGTTAGFLGSKSTDNNQFSNSYDIPFIGTYLVATKGRFFADLMVRQDYYNVTLNNVGLNYFNQPVGAHGYSLSTSAGYNFALQNNWFIEPSAGFIYSRTSVDSYTNTGTSGLPIGGTISTNDVISEIGRLSVRVGTTIATPNIVWQPFASASVFHEFAGNVTTNYSSYANNNFTCGLAGCAAAPFNQTTSTTRVGTYGQYSIGVAGQIVNSGWLGFVRADYRNGDRIDGWTGNAGLRYQFTPGAMDAMAADMPMKVKAPRPLAVTNWTGFYMGGFFGVDAGRTDITFVGAPVPTTSRPWVFGPIGGGQIGYNWQAQNNWVFGVEGDIGAANIKGARQCGTDPALLVGVGTPTGALASAYFTCGDKTDWVATASARVGYSYNRTLYYVRGGAAWEDSTVSANCILGPAGAVANPTPPPANIRSCTTGQGIGVLQTNVNTGSTTRVGWLIGFGTEFDLGKGWSAKTEYNYIDFGRHTALASDGFTTLSDRSNTSQVKVGVNYRFTPGAVVAKY
jgi:opacity protein-like surface antigen